MSWIGRADSGILQRGRAGDRDPVSWIGRADSGAGRVTVYLVGAGPGDPGLVTVRGAQLLSRADVVIYDRLSVAALLDLAPARAQRISVGKRSGVRSISQQEINELLVDQGRVHDVVVRLKGGDPFVFARGGEEAAALQAAGIAYEIVPGITSAIAAPAYAGIPLTLRYSSTAFTVVTGHEDPSKPDGLDWDAVARLGGTIVILMGVGRIRSICERLLAGGLAPDTPAAAVHWGTRPQQSTVRATLATLADQPLEAPSAIVIGQVAASELRWFESRPLFGRTVVVTRTRRQASELVAALRERGAEPVEVPTIEIAEPADGGAGLRAAVAGLATYDWVVLTSPNGAERFLAELPDARALGTTRIATIGPATAKVLTAAHLVADLVPPEYVAESLLDAFPDGPGRVLLARAAVARDVLPDGLRAKGWHVDVVEAYRTVAAPTTDAQRSSLSSADVVTFTSSSTVERFVGAFGADATPPIVACIGPITAATARRLGIEVAIVAPVHTIAGLVDALTDHFGAS